MADSHYGFRHVDELGSSLVSDQIEANVVSWLQWGFLGVGAFINTDRADAVSYGTRPYTKLRPVVDPRFPAAAGRTYIFEGARNDWVWESGVPYATQPTSISGIWVTGSFVASSSTGIYQHKVSYPEGRVVFSSAVPTGTDVQINHSFRQVHVRRADEPWFQEVAFRSFRTDEEFDQPAGSGGPWEVLSQNRVQLPAVVVDVVDRVRLKPYEIGSTARIHQQECMLHVLTETPWERRKLHDILVEQFDHRIPTFDRNEITFPLDYMGSPISGAQTYPSLVNSDPWRQLRIANIESTPQSEVGKKLYWTTVRYTLEIDAP